MRQCPHCEATEAQTTYGRTMRGSQRYKCRECARVYTPQPLPLGYAAEIKREAVRLYLEGIDFRRIGRIQMRAYALVDFRGITLDPAKHGRVVHIESTLAHHFCDIAVGELISAIPPDTQNDDRGLVVPPLERGLILFHEYDSQQVMDELKGGL